MKRKPKTINFWTGRLPHWEVEDGRYFITMHVAGAIPQAAKNQIQSLGDRLCQISSPSPPDWLRLQRLIFNEMEKWLHRAQYNPWLQQHVIAELLAEAIHSRQQRNRWNIFSFVLMPNHIHLFGEIPAGEMKTALEDFKRCTGHRAVKLLSLKPARFWQREWFDHWSRSDEQDDRILAYIRNNLIKAGLDARFSQWPYFFARSGE